MANLPVQHAEPTVGNLPVQHAEPTQNKKVNLHSGASREESAYYGVSTGLNRKVDLPCGSGTFLLCKFGKIS